MAIISHRLRLVYLPVPKNACSTVKTMIFEADSGRPVTTLRQPDGRPVSIHKVFASVPDGGSIPPGLDGYEVLAVLRDPVERFASGWRNRIAELGDIDRLARRSTRLRRLLEGHGLPTRPDPATLAANLARYMAAVPLVRHHFLPQAAFVADVADRITLAVGLDGLDRVAALLAGRSGAPVALPRLQASLGTTPAVAPDPATEEALRRFYAADYALLARFGLGRA